MIAEKVYVRATWINAKITEGEPKAVFPLYTQRALRERWGIARNVLTNWKDRHDDFPRPVDGLIVTGYNDGDFYPAYEVERYEEARGGKDNVAKHNAARKAGE